MANSLADVLPTPLTVNDLVLTGTPTAPTATLGDDSTQIATTEFVIANAGSGSGVTSVFSRTGVVTATSGDYTVGEVTGAAPLASPTFTGTPSLPTGTTGVTQSPGNSTTALATTAFVQTALPSVPVASVFGRTGTVAAASADYAVGQVTGAAPLASPAFTGTPSLPTGTTGVTQTANNNSTALATTAYVDRASGSAAKSVAAPTLTTSTTGVMMGLDLAYTPTIATKAFVVINGCWANSVLADGVKMQLRYGTGTAPTNGAVLTGTTAGSLQSYNKEAVAGDQTNFTLCFLITGLSVGTAYWIDMSLAAITGGNASVTTVDAVALETT